VEIDGALGGLGGEVWGDGAEAEAGLVVCCCCEGAGGGGREGEGAEGAGERS